MGGDTGLKPGCHAQSRQEAEPFAELGVTSSLVWGAQCPAVSPDELRGLGCTTRLEGNTGAGTLL